MVLQRARRALPPLVLGLVLAQCGKDGAGPGTLRPAALIRVSGNGQTGTVGQNLGEPLVVKVTTSDGRAVSNVTVAWSVTAGGGSLTAASTQTDASGLASVVWSLGTTAGANNQTARAGVAGLTGSPVAFTASANAAPASRMTLVSGDDQPGTVGQLLQQTLVVRVADPFDNPVSGTTVAWAVTGGGGTLSAAAQPSDASGLASVSWTLGPTAGAQTATAAVAGLTGSPVSFAAQAAAGVATQLAMVSGTSQTGAAGTSLGAPLVVAVRDAFGNPKSGVTVTWAVTAGGGTLSSDATPTDAAGQASVTWTLGTAAGPQAATATVAGLGGSPLAFSAAATAGAPAQLTLLSGDNQSGVVGAALGTPFIVKVTDTFGNPAPGTSVTWAVTAGGGTIAPAAPTTDAAGLAAATLTLDTVAGTNTNTATASVAGVSGSPVTFTASATPAAATRLLSCGVYPAVAGTVGGRFPYRLVVCVTDQFGNGVPGVSVFWSVPPGAATLDSLITVTDSLGRATNDGTLGPVAGSVPVQASVPALLGSPVTMVLTAVAGSATQVVEVSGSGQSGTVGASLASPFVVRVTDAFGNPVAGAAVTWAVTAGGGSIAAVGPATDAVGLASATLTLGTALGTNNNAATAEAAGLAGSPVTFTASASAAGASQIALVSGNSQTGTVGTALAIPFVVRVSDVFGNPVSGVAVAWTVTAGGGSIAPPNAVTTLAGLASATLTLGTTAGAGGNTAVAAASGLMGSPVAFTASANSDAAVDLALLSGDAQAGAAGQALAQPLVVVARDQFGNPVAGVTVAWAVTGGGGMVSSASTPTDATGQATVTWTLGTGVGAQAASASAGGLTGSPVSFSATAAAAAAAQLALVSGDAQTGTVGAALASPLVVRVTDAFGNPVAGAAVTWAVTAGGGSIAPAVPTTDVAGLASATLLLGAAAGAATNAATASATGLAGSPLTFTANATPDAATTLVLVSGNAQSATAGQTLTQPLVVEARDQFGNGVSGVTVMWAVDAGGGGLSSASMPTNAAGQASVTWTLGMAAGAQTSHAAVAGLSGSPVSFSATAGAGAAAQIALVSGNGQSGTVNTALASALVVRVTDAFGNPVAGTSVTWAVMGGGGVIAPAAPTTDAAGLASAMLTLGTGGGVANTVTASATGVSGSPVTFTASATAGAASQLALASGNGQTGTVGTALASPFVVQVIDAFGNPVAGTTVNWAVTGGGGAIAATSISNALGQASATLTLGTTTGASNNTATASAGVLSGSPVPFTASATADAAAQIALVSGDAQTDTVGQILPDSLLVQVKDQYGNPVGGVSVSWFVTAGGGSVSSTAVATDGAGRAGVTWTLGTSAGVSQAVTAAVTGLSGSPVSFGATAVAGAAAQLALASGNNQAATVGTALPAPFVVLVTDNLGNPVAGTAVIWAVTGGGGSLSTTGSSSDAAGHAATSLTLGLAAGANNNTATATVSGLAGSPLTFTASANSAAATQIALVSGDGQAAPVGTALALPLVVEVRDLSNNPVSGVTVGWSVTSGGGGVSAADVVTDGAGQASVTWTLGGTAGAQTVQAGAGGLFNFPITFTATATAGAAAQIVRVSGNGQSGTVNAALASPFVVRVIDSFGNPVSGTAVDWVVTSGGGAIAPAAPTTDAAGLAAATLTVGPTSGTGNNTATATATGLIGSPVAFTASGTAAAAAQLAPVSGDNQTGIVNSALAAPFVVQVTDAFGNPKGGVTVTWAVTAGGGAIATSSITNASGQASATLTLGTSAGTDNDTVTASVTGLTGSPVAFTASADAAPASQIALASGNGQSATVNTALASPFVVQVSDAFGNPKNGVTVTWSVTAGAGTIPASSLTDAAGQASATLTLGTLAGTNNNTATASVSGLSGTPVTFTASGAAGAASQLVLVSGNGQSGTVNTALASALVVKATDSFGNAVAGVTVSWVVTAGGGVVVPVAPATDASGRASATLTLGTAAGTSSNSATASASGLSGSPVTFTASATAAAATQIALLSGNNQTGTVGAALASSFVVLVSDAFGNPVAGTTVFWAATAGGGSIAPLSSVTDAAGQATATRTLGTVAGTSNNGATATVSGLTGSPVSFTASADAGPAAQLAFVSGDGQTGTVSAALPTPFIVRVADQYGNSVAGATVAWMVIAGSGSIPVSSLTDASGQAAATLTLGTGAGTNTHSATAAVPGASGSPVTFTASATAGAPAQLALVSGNNQSGTVNTTLASPLVVRVMDAFGNPTSGVTVDWAATGGGGVILPATTTSDAAGQASATLTLGTLAGAGNNTATASGAGLAGSPVSFAASATAGAAAQLALVAGNNQSGTVNAALASPFVVRVADTFGNGVAGVTVTWAVTAGGGVIAPSSVTDAGGLAPATLTLGIAAGTGNHTATADVAGLAGSPVAFTASATAAAASQLALVSGNDQSGTVGTALASPYVVRVADAFGNPKSGVTVSWAATAGGGSMSAPSSVTDAAGDAAATLILGTTAGTANHTATAAVVGLAGSPVTFTASAVAAAASQLARVSGNNQTGTVAAALASPLVVRVTDAFGNPVPGTSVAWTIATGGGSIAPPSNVTNAAGEASATLTLGTTAGSGNQTATASATGLVGSPVTFTASATAAAASQLASFSGNTQSGTVNQALASPFVVRVRDAFGNSVSGYTVSWAVTLGGGAIPATSVSDPSGLASAIATLGTAAGSDNNAATASGSGLSGSPVTFTASAAAGPAAQLAPVSGNNQAGNVGAALPVPFVVIVTDAFGNPVAGTTVDWAVTGGGGSITPGSAVTDAAGHASATLTLGIAAGTNNNTATATGAGLSGSPVTFSASANSTTATQIALVSGNGQTATVGLAVSQPLVVVARDAFDNPVAGVTVGWAVTAGGGGVSSAAVVTDGAGQAAVTWTMGTSAGPQTVQASAGGLSGSPVTFTATALAGAASQIALVSGNNQSGTVGAALASGFIVRVTDAAGNPVAGTTVTWAVTGGGGAIAPAAPVTDGAGLAAATLTLGTSAGTGNNTVTAGTAGLTGSPVTFTASASAGAASQLTLVSGNAQTDTVAQTLPLPLVVAVADAFGNPVSGVAVSWGVTAGGGSVSAAAVPTDGAGQAAVTWTLGGPAGANTATASAGLLSGSPVAFTALAVAGAPAQIAPVSGNGQSGTVATALGDSLVVRVTDALGNAVSGTTVSWAAVAGGGTVTPAAPTTNAAGLAWARLTLGTAAGANRDTVTASSAGLSGSPVVFAATASAAAATQMSLNGGNAQTAPAGTALPTPLSVLVRDTYGNPVPDVTVSWAVTSGGGSLSVPSSLSNGSGVASVTRTLGLFAGTHTAMATVSGLTGSPLTFTATATPNGTISGAITTASGFLALSAATTDMVQSDVTAVALPQAAQLLTAKPARRETSLISAQMATGRRTPQYVPDELIVTYRAAALAAPPVGSRALAAPAMARGVATTIRARLAAGAAAGRFLTEGVSPVVLSARVRVSEVNRLDEVMAELRRDPAVASVARNALVYADATTPNDPDYFWQAWGFDMIDLPRAWDITTGSATVLVAVVDDGMRPDHPGISANLTTDGRDFVSDITLDKCGGGTISNAGDGGGYDAIPTIPQAYTFNSALNCASGPNTTGGHGLHVAGTIGAVGNDGVGTSGVNWTVRIRPVRVLGVAGVGTAYDIAQGILYAAGLPADDGVGGTVTAPSAARIINLSLGTTTDDTTLHNAVTAATGAGALLVASAGNDGTSTPNYPAAYPEVVSVTAVGPDGVRASYSSFGSTVDIAAPGGDIGDGGGDPSFGIYSTRWSFATNTPIHDVLQGTSMAAPHVSGVAALLLAQNPSLTAAELRSRLEGYAVDAGVAGLDDQYGYGIVNARNSLTQSFEPPHQLYARLYDATSGAVVQTVAVAGNGSYAFSALADGDYFVYAGEDENGDGQVGLPGRRWGAYGGASIPTVVTVSGAGISTRSFTIALPLETEPNNDELSQNVLPVGGYLNAAIGTFFDSDVSRLVIPAAGTYTLETSGRGGQCGYALAEDTHLYLYDSALNLVTFNDDVSGTNACSRVTVALSPGLYYVQVLGYNARGYRVQVRTGP